MNQQDSAAEQRVAFVLFPKGQKYDPAMALYVYPWNELSGAHPLLDVFEKYRVLSTGMLELDLNQLANISQQIIIFAEVTLENMLQNATAYFPEMLKQYMQQWNTLLPAEFIDLLPKAPVAPWYLYIVSLEEDGYSQSSSLVCREYESLSNTQTVEDFCEEYQDITLDDDEETDCQTIATELGCVVVHVLLNSAKVPVKHGRTEYQPEPRWAGTWPR